MADFELQVKMFTDQLTELIEQAKFEASQEFNSERSNWEQRAREYEEDIRTAVLAAQKSLERAEAAEAKHEALREKLAGLV